MQLGQTQEDAAPWYLDEVKSQFNQTVPENLRTLFWAYLDNPEFAFLCDNFEFIRIKDENFGN